MEQLDALLTPYWGSEPWIIEGWSQLSEDEKNTIQDRVDVLFKEGLPFKIEHETTLYIHLFALMAQLAVLGINLPIKFDEPLKNPAFKKRLQAQLLDEFFHALVFTRILFLLSAPFGAPPVYNEPLEKMCALVRSQRCAKIKLTLMNVIRTSLMEELFHHLYQFNIAPELFDMILKKEYRPICDTDLKREIGLPNPDDLAEILHQLEHLGRSACLLQTKYAATLSSLLGSKGSTSLISELYNIYTQQLNTLNVTPGKNLELLIQLSANTQAERDTYLGDLDKELNNEFYPIEMSPIKKILMTQFNAPGDPTVVVQFNVDISDFCFYQKEHPNEHLTVVMMQAFGHLLEHHDSFRNFINYKKLVQSRSSYVSLVEKLPECGDHLGTISFKNCQNLNAMDLLNRIKRNQQMMIYCYNKREHIETNHPQLKQRLNDLLYSEAHEPFASPTPGSCGIFLSNIGAYGYTQAVFPILKNSSVHVLLLAVEKKNIWNNETQTFETKDILPVSISADGRIFDGMLPIPDLLSNAFQSVLKKNKETITNPQNNPPAQKENMDTITEHILNKAINHQSNHLARNVRHKNKKALLNQVQRIFGDDFRLDDKKVTEYANFKNIADHLLLDYLGFDAEEASKNANFTKNIDKILAEDLELGYHILFNLQTVWVDYIDIEAAYNAAYKKIARSRINLLAQTLPFF